ncbi:MAG: 2OG-Fe(II) oxygenase [Rhodococcus sp. (in: high G+C Gram-positive bacteria)]|uniref:prolyl hydroxylase family protein n=1 Tax=Rhodococcus sp. TaxID=1831 RepID=UPI003BAEA651
MSDSGRTAVLCDAPRIALTLGVIEPDLAQSLIAIAAPVLSTALVSQRAGEATSLGRTCEVAKFAHDHSPTVSAIVDAMSVGAGIDARLSESLNVIRYSVGGQYKPHFDAYPLVLGRRYTKGRGQRTHTAIGYLNDQLTGGATIFPRLGVEVTPQTGAMLMFENCTRRGIMRDKKSLHAGEPVRRGEKWVATLWFRQRPG